MAPLAVGLVPACSPAGSDEQAPPLLEVSPGTLAFSEESSRFMEVKNAGGGTLAFEIGLSAEVDGITWLSVEPTSGAVAGGAGKSVLVQLVNVAALKPGSYLGEITVEAEGQGAANVLVTLVIGQPVLGVIPDSEIDFGGSADTATLAVRNDGKGELLYSISYPGKWLVPDSTIAVALGPGEAATVLLTVDRALVPWYGPGQDDLVISSNGLTDAEHQGTRKLAVKVDVDAFCNQDADCTKPGYYCDKSGGPGTCTPRLTNGGVCVLPNQCHSGFCADGFCCDQACTDQCQSCGHPGQQGTCGQDPKDAPCDDGNPCTATDGCQAGACVGSGTLDCSPYNTACGVAVCLPEKGGCSSELPPGKCLIEKQCFDQGATSPGQVCLICDPSADPEGWSVAPGTCHIGGACYAEGEAVIGECLECDPDDPGVPALKPDGASCEDDGNACTDDVCEQGSCIHLPLEGQDCDDAEMCTADDRCSEKGECKGDIYSCDDALECTEDACDGLGGCTHAAVPNGMPCGDDGLACTLDACQGGACFHLPDALHCLVDGQCVAANSAAPDEACLLCLPAVSPVSYSPASNLPCADDGVACTKDLCQAGECTHEVESTSCLIAGQCVPQLSPHPDTTCLACQPQVDPLAWTPANEGMACDDKLFCMVNETCSGGLCLGQKLDCGDQCHKGLCSDITDECVPVPLADGKGCDDLDPCTVGDACVGGQCAGSAKDCSAEVELMPCTHAVCHPDSFPVPGECTAELNMPGSSCDDGKACLEETTCTALGACTGGQVLTAELCAGLLGVTGQCASAVCQEPAGCTETMKPDGTDCKLPNAVAKCKQGSCVLVSCLDASYGDCDGAPETGCESKLWLDIENCGKCGIHCSYANAWADCESGSCSLLQCMDGYSDCDGKSATGCESNTAADAMNCGLCGKTCGSGNAAKVGVCVADECQLQACPVGWWNLDGSPGNGCECQYGGKELCNGYDDNCDGVTDEGFNLFSDPDNCGACGTVCAAVDALAVECLNARCMVTACPEGFVDKNGQVEDGCEYELFHVGEIWVDAGNAGDLLEDGSEQHPFDTLQEGLLAAFPSYVVHVAEGSYVGPFTIDKPGIILSGVGVEQTALAGTPAEATLVITANDVTVTSLAVVNGRYGVHFLGTAESHLSSGAIADVKALGAATPGGSGLESAGVRIEYADSVTVSMVEISGFIGGKGAPAGMGGHACGVSVFWSDLTVVAASTISTITSGQGGGSTYSNGRSGVASGIRLDHSVGALIVGNMVTGILGAAGAPGGGEHVNGATGGLAAGIYLTAAAGNEISANQMSELKGGPGGSGYGDLGASPAQEAFGVYLTPDGVSNVVDLRNRVEDDVIAYLHGASAVVLAGLELTSAANPTNLGKIVVLESSDVRVTGCVVSHIAGESGQTGGSGAAATGTPGAEIAGIRLDHCSGCVVDGNVVSEVVGGRGGHGGRNATGWAPGGPAGAGPCILVTGSAGVEVVGNVVSACSGGPGGLNGWTAGPDGIGGSGYGYRLVDNSQVTFRSNVASGVKGGWGRTPWPNWGTCVLIDESAGLALEHLTCHDAGAADGAPGAGVQLGAAQIFSVKVTNSIINAVAGYGLVGLASNPGLLHATYSDLFACTSGPALNALVLTGCFSVDPLFDNMAEQVFTLQPLSPCIDVGDPTADCNLEAAPNGCRVDLGAFGNTDKSTAAPGAPHCNVCPEP
jgi:hypothetical protein